MTINSILEKSPDLSKQYIKFYQNTLNGDFIVMGHHNFIILMAYIKPTIGI